MGTYLTVKDTLCPERIAPWLFGAPQATDTDEHQLAETLQRTREKALDFPTTEPTNQQAEEDRMNGMRAYWEIFYNNLRGISVPISPENTRSIPVHHGEISISTKDRVRASILSRLRAKPNRSRCPDLEGGAGQLDPQKNNNSFEQHEQKLSADGLHPLLELILWCLSMASCWMMERLARPGVSPSAVIYVASILVYAATTGTAYFIYSDGRAMDLWVVFGGLCGMICGWIISWHFEKILFRLLPGFILSGLFIGSRRSQRLRA